MPFELETPTAAKLIDVTVLSDKDRAPETNPGAGLDFAMTVGNDMLTMFDGYLRAVLFTKNASTETPQQASLEGVPPASDMPNLTEIGKKLGQFGWDLELTGYALTLDHGMGGPKSNITLDDCKLTNWRFKCKREREDARQAGAAEDPRNADPAHGAGSGAAGDRVGVIDEEAVNAPYSGREALCRMRVATDDPQPHALMRYENAETGWRKPNGDPA